MKVNKASLIEFVDSAIARLEARHADSQVEYKALEEQHLVQWERDWGAKWDAALEDARKARRAFLARMVAIRHHDYTISQWERAIVEETAFLEQEA